MTGLLSGGLQATFGNVFSQFFLDGTLHTDRKQAVVGGRPSGPVVWTDTPCKLMVDTYSDAYRLRTGIPDTDVRIIVLQLGVSVNPTTDSEITARGTRYKIMSVEMDPAQASWTFRGRPVG